MDLAEIDSPIGGEEVFHNCRSGLPALKFHAQCHAGNDIIELVGITKRFPEMAHVRAKLCAKWISPGNN